MEKQLTGCASIIFGADPEFFFENSNGEIVGAEKVIPKEGLIHAPKVSYYDQAGGFVLDGVQVELNPRPSTCRQSLSSDIATAFRNLKKHLNNKPEFKASFTSVIEIKPEELESLSEQAKVFGCAPSLNVNGKGNEIKIDAAKYLTRAAGGHIHIGLTSYPNLMKNREYVVPFMDILVGLICVMVDRDPNQVTRRLHYGRAGEYRLPKHGLEYRTLSNFWLRNYFLVSMVMGLSRLAVSIAAKAHPNDRPPQPNYGYTKAQWNHFYPIKNYELDLDIPNALLNSVDLKEVEKTINENDLELAKKIYYDSIRPFIVKHIGAFNITSAGLNNELVKPFDFFLEKVWSDGLSYWFPEDTMTHWNNVHVGYGWETFLSNDVSKKKNEGDLKIK